MTILHASDLHFGAPHRPAVAAALLRFAREARPHAIVVSGDLTQRAKTGEYRAARDFLAGLPRVPLVVTAGNHDVPLYRVWERLLAPYRNYRRHISRRLDTVLDVAGEGDAPGLRFVALNSTAPLSAIVNGRLGHRQFAFAAGAFAGTPRGARRVLVLHHSLLRPDDGEPVSPLPRARRVLRRAEAWGVDLVLAGHIHRTHLAWSGGDGGSGRGGSGSEAGSERGSGLPVVVAGTASSSRGRVAEKGRNSLNVVRVHGSGIDVTVYLYCREAGRFIARDNRRFVRRAKRRVDPPIR